MGNGELSDTDWVSEIDIDQAIPAASRRVLTGLRAGRAPEVAPVLLSIN